MPYFRLLLRLISTVCAVSVSVVFAGARAEQRTACNFSVLGTFDTGAIVDARTFRLRDGREVLLAGIEVPSGSVPAKAFLEKLLSSGKVLLKQTEPSADRYGRLPVQAFVQRDGVEHWIQEELLAAGLAQVSSRPGGAACAKALLESEAQARRSRTGLWTDSSYRIKASDDSAALVAGLGRFAVAEGKVLSVRESGGTIYINFGRVWSRNLTVTVARGNLPAFAAAGMDPKKLEGVHVRVRGWLEERNGPRIEAVRPEQIEIATRE